MKKILSVLLAFVLVFALCACGSSSQSKKFNVGICQLVQHEALDAATQGFIDALKEELGDAVEFDNQNASGDIPTCATICNGFVADGDDLILANATPALQAAVAATDSIPVLGTAITEYGVALDIADFGGVVGGNISGTSDLAPLDQQAKMIVDLFPEAQNVAILYCSAEANSVYQAAVVKDSLEAAGLKVNISTFADSNDVAAVTQQACSENDVLYIPTDNTAASCAEAINNVAVTAGVPIVAGEEGLCAGCGVAALSISYFDLGFATGQMAVEILREGADVSAMEVRFAPQFTKKFNAPICEALGITPPGDYVVIE